MTTFSSVSANVGFRLIFAFISLWTNDNALLRIGLSTLGSTVNVPVLVDTTVRLSCKAKFRRWEFTKMNRFDHNSETTKGIVTSGGRNYNQNVYNVIYTASLVTLTILSVRYEDAGLYSCWSDGAKYGFEIIVLGKPVHHIILQ